jgi:hypothetical protein
MSNFTHEDFLTFSAASHPFRVLPQPNEDRTTDQFLDEFEPELELLSSFKLSPRPEAILRIHEELYRES